MATYIAAISGGVDSVVLLDMLAQGNDEIIVAHVDHGIRDDSADDARFVAGLARQYGVTFECAHVSLGERASEQQAREARYQFLYELAKKYSATIVTAHHGDDLAETIAINLHRGTGWRGLAVLNRQGIWRPLLTYSKQDLYHYALARHLEWVEDKTNGDWRYLRNQIRANLRPKLSQKDRQRLYNLRQKQVMLKDEIDAEALKVIRGCDSRRYLLTNCDTQTAVELLGAIIQKQAGLRPQRPQLERALHAVKTARPGAVVHVGDRTVLRFSTRDFSVEVLQ